MLTKHFFKILVIFMGMILLGLVGIFIVNHFDEDGQKITTVTPACKNGEKC